MTNEQMLDQLIPAASSLLEAPAAVLWLAPAIVAVVASVAMQDQNYRQRHRLHVALGLLAFAYVVAIVAIAMWPWNFQVTDEPLRYGNWVPVRGAIGFLFSGDPIHNYLGERQVLSNLLLLAPLGLVLPIVFGGIRGFATVFFLAIAAVAIPLTAALVGTDRIFDIDDGIAAVTGGLAAAVVTSAAHSLASYGRLAVR